MNSKIFKLSQLFLNGPESCDLQSIKKEMEDIDQMATIRMGKIEWFDFDNKKSRAAAIATLVSKQKKTNFADTHTLEFLINMLHIY